MPCLQRRQGAATDGSDPAMGATAPLFNPRTCCWDDHVAWAADGATLVGRTPTGAATVARLNLNQPLQTGARPLWRRLGFFPERAWLPIHLGRKGPASRDPAATDMRRQCLSTIGVGAPHCRRPAVGARREWLRPGPPICVAASGGPLSGSGGRCPRWGGAGRRRARAADARRAGQFRRPAAGLSSSAANTRPAR